VDIVTKSIEKSVEFYSKYLKYSVVEDTKVISPAAMFLSNNQTDSMRLVFLKRNNRSPMIELIQFLDSSGKELILDDGFNLNLSLSFLVNDVPDSISELSNDGLLPVSDIFKIELINLGTTRIVFYQDPDGHLIEMISAFNS